mmetsp:Transcript_40671/g.65277  ORF Transcript_40671/g.65277 Transcript_40671/m.65277 type:complete len:201 (-) Transcript_40671:43-645(-)
MSSTFSSCSCPLSTVCSSKCTSGLNVICTALSSSAAASVSCPVCCSLCGSCSSAFGCSLLLPSCALSLLPKFHIPISPQALLDPLLVASPPNALAHDVVLTLFSASDLSTNESCGSSACRLNENALFVVAVVGASKGLVLSVDLVSSSSSLCSRSSFVLTLPVCALIYLLKMAANSLPPASSSGAQIFHIPSIGSVTFMV